ncbi:hypothetical protein FJZ17_04075 [Candidatus Pacearchaeota archaeon]|nr:hypothetical protein [Candidatus Pacearchaeota archaeon]
MPEKRIVDLGADEMAFSLSHNYPFYPFLEGEAGYDVNQDFGDGSKRVSLWVCLGGVRATNSGALYDNIRELGEEWKEDCLGMAHDILKTPRIPVADLVVLATRPNTLSLRLNNPGFKQVADEEDPAVVLRRYEGELQVCER